MEWHDIFKVLRGKEKKNPNKQIKKKPRAKYILPNKISIQNRSHRVSHTRKNQKSLSPLI